MAYLGKRQVSATVHQCVECLESILPGDLYCRVTVVPDADFEALTGRAPDPKALFQPVSKAGASRIMQFVARSGAPVVKYHAECWEAKDGRAA